MVFLPLKIACPGCGSNNLVYSCDPACCFNHVCGDCLNNFELLTRDLGETIAFADTEPEEKDTCAPTVACARCKSLSVYATAESSMKLFCASCHALLELEFS
jgi:hypothetical protein